MKHLSYIALAIALPVILAAYIIALGHTPLTDALIVLPSETEVLLYTVQAGIGAAVIGHFFGYRKGEKTKKLVAAKNSPQKQKIDLKYLVTCLILIAVVVVIFIVPFMIHPNAEFGGTDDQGAEIIEGGGYTPWFDPFGLELGEVGQIAVFSLQAAIGAVIIGYFVGNTRAKGH